ncbi:MAG: rRNA maturation RNase YbeY [Elusimicrobia bacterium]|nr:rRNA maturation RNase YbeY [Elusimicrobiota bacterium]MDE2314229.1 rRNA maturation RNase YbeY [Elusimicrobiota bacterium]
MGKQALTVRAWGLGLLPPTARKPRLLARACRAALAELGERASGDLNLIFVGRRRMRALNKRFLRHSHDTDVVAFAYGEGPAFGDVFVSAFQARRQARELGHSALEEVLTLAVHGCLHLAGYDDHKPKDKAAMFRRQDAALKSLGF